MKTENETVKQVNLKERVDAFERDLVFEALKRAKGNQSRAARILGTSQRILKTIARASPLRGKRA